MMAVIDISVQGVSCRRFTSRARWAHMLGDKGPVSKAAHVEAPSVASSKQGQRVDLEWTNEAGGIQGELDEYGRLKQ